MSGYVPNPKVYLRKRREYVLERMERAVSELQAAMSLSRYKSNLKREYPEHTILRHHIQRAVAAVRGEADNLKKLTA